MPERERWSAPARGLRTWYCDDRVVDLPAGHRFPMQKYQRLRSRLLELGLLRPEQLERAPDAEPAQLLKAHSPDYVEAVLTGSLAPAAVRRLGFPWSKALVARSLASVGGTLAATQWALEHGIGSNLAGGTHHAYRGFGSGFCVFNDLAVSAYQALDSGRVRRVLIFDVDVHQGDGTAAIFAEDARVFTCSLHGDKNFPARKESSDLDVPLADGLTDGPYLAALAAAWRSCLDQARPDLVLFQAGVDPLAEDRLGRLALSHAGLESRDRFLHRAAQQAGLPQVWTLGGGYGEPLEATLDAHLGTYRVLAGFGASPSRPPDAGLP
jgi:acetoin utilization deacetylase AcuC-like enzyme